MQNMPRNTATQTWVRAAAGTTMRIAANLGLTPANATLSIGVGAPNHNREPQHPEGRDAWNAIQTHLWGKHGDCGRNATTAQTTPYEGWLVHAALGVSTSIAQIWHRPARTGDPGRWAANAWIPGLTDWLATPELACLELPDAIRVMYTYDTLCRRDEMPPTDALTTAALL